MSDVSPSLVEAAARAAELHKEAYFAATEAWLDPARKDDTGNQRMHSVVDAVLAAVGGALRLEGAQAERERVEKALRYALRTRGPLGDEACLAAALDALKL